MTRIIIEVDGDDVKVSTETKEAEVVNESVNSEVKTLGQYARFFNEECTAWCTDALYNLMYLRTLQDYANCKLRVKGHLVLNDVYDMLGIPRTKIGCVVGWIYDKNNPIGDNYVDFGLDDTRNRDFVNGYVNVAILDFNVDGEIISRL